MANKSIDTEKLDSILGTILALAMEGGTHLDDIVDKFSVNAKMGDILEMAADRFDKIQEIVGKLKKSIK